jgi:hypothetical protein
MYSSLHTISAKQGTGSFCSLTWGQGEAGLYTCQANARSHGGFPQWQPTLTRGVFPITAVASRKIRSLSGALCCVSMACSEVAARLRMPDLWRGPVGTACRALGLQVPKQPWVAAMPPRRAQDIADGLYSAESAAHKRGAGLQHSDDARLTNRVCGQPRSLAAGSSVITSNARLCLFGMLLWRWNRWPLAARVGMSRRTALSVHTWAKERFGLGSAVCSRQYSMVAVDNHFLTRPE